MPESEAEESFDVLVAGAGATGLSLALALAQTGRRVALVGRLETGGVGRTVALLDSSLRFYRSQGLWSAIEAHAAPLRTMRIVDDTDSLFRSRPVDFRSTEIGLDAFGANIENSILCRVLASRVADTPSLVFVEGRVERYEFGDDDICAEIGSRRLRAKLLVAADGRQSAARTAAGIQTYAWSYPQVALTAILKHASSHEDVSTEFHTRGGPFTLVPLPARPDAPHRSSLVWMMRPREAQRIRALNPEALARAIEDRSHYLLGRVEVASDLGALPMSGLRARRLTLGRTALVGDAAHSFPPIGAQGLNLGLRDAADLVHVIAHAPDPGAPSALAAYERRRRGDILARTAGVDLLNRCLLSSALPADFIRGFALTVLGAAGPLRRAAMRVGLAPPPLDLPDALRSLLTTPRGSA